MVKRLLVFISPLALLGLVYLLVQRPDTDALPLDQVQEVAEADTGVGDEGGPDREETLGDIRGFASLQKGAVPRGAAAVAQGSVAS